MKLRSHISFENDFGCGVVVSH